MQTSQMPERSLYDLLAGEADSALSEHIAVRSIEFDSRRVQAGAVFFAVPGVAEDGARYIADAAARGAAAVVYQRDAQVSIPAGLAAVPVPDVRRALGSAAARWYEEPSKALRCVGVTGTNGKTSIAWMTAEAGAASFGSWLQLGTLGARLARPGEKPLFHELSATTPDPLTIQSELAAARSSSAAGAVLEASSHASVQQRTCGVQWDVMAFSNLTRDHLDYHSSMEDYFAAKRRLFIEELAGSCKPRRCAVIFTDCSYGRRLAGDLGACPGLEVITVSKEERSARCRLVSADCSTRGIRLELNYQGSVYAIESALVGAFNVENLLIAFGILNALGVAPAEAAAKLETVAPVPGRLERIESAGGPSVFVDYAHTPAALDAACTALRALKPRRLLVVFGCGGDRDRGKRPQMGEVVRDRADFAIVTSDNPRTEDPEQIIRDVVEAFRGSSSAFETIADRKQAIARAIAAAEPGDIVLIAGKGHEPYQEVCGVRRPFDDREIARQELSRCAR